MLSPVLAPLVPSAQLLIQRLGLTRTMATWLARKGHQESAHIERFLRPRLADLTVPDAMADRSLVSRRLALAIRRRERVAVFGDYDCDGITAAAIMTEVIRACGGEAVPLIASRFDGGYGVSSAALRRILDTGARLLVTCDCGSSDHDSLLEIGRRGVDVVVIDHHLVPERALPALGFLNPHRPDCGFAYKGLASCGLALSVAAGLRKELGIDLDLRYWLDLVAVGTIADVAPLDGDNRCLVRAGLDAILKARRPGMEALLEIAKITRDSPLTGRDVAFRIAPQINAPGRLGSADLALELLLAKDVTTARGLAARLEQISTQRRALSDEMLEQATREIADRGYDRQAAIVLGRGGWNPGVVGIVAGRLAAQFARPVIVVGFDGERGRGSVRGPTGARLHDALTHAAAALERFGGHQQAAGLELRADRLEDFRERFVAAVESQGTLPVTDPASVDLLPLDAADEPFAVLADLDRLEPCGFANPRPRLMAEARVVSAREVKNGHLKLVVELAPGRLLGCFAVNQGARAGSLGGQVRLVGDLRHNTFPGAEPVEMFVEDLGMSGGETSRVPRTEHQPSEVSPVAL
jgi:single-stranded-DNA-specific exonuclease